MTIAHRTAAFLMGVGVLVAIAITLGEQRSGFPNRLQGPARGVDVAATAYLAISAMAQWRLVRLKPSQRRSKQSLRASAAAHAMVVTCLVWIAMRGPHARTYLAGRDLLVAELATAAVLSMVLLLAATRTPPEKTEPIQPEKTAWPGIQLLASLLLVSCLAWLETRSIDP